MVLMIFIITPFGGLINESMKNFLTAAGAAGEYVYGCLLYNSSNPPAGILTPLPSFCLKKKTSKH
ncbi:hypothetical protein KGF51_21815 [Clostridioides sp. ZZV14-6045]|uniref:hypothetical protein n=1 Tax=Clostridioides sp. ZZV14-6045 TaxID=2811489 RepID=UPI001D1074AB|nr:hypothetical protein [Clostridioides sp. ZZV14-6045]